MSETVARHRPSVDLDDFERRARQPMRPQQHHQGYEDDPLAELARLVGEEPDPYGDVFARSPAPSHDDGSHDATQRREAGLRARSRLRLDRGRPSRRDPGASRA